MFFRGRGTSYLAERDASGIIGAARAICQDAISIALATDAGEHINKCGPVDSPDDRYIKSSTGTVTFSYSDVADKNLAVGVLGTVTPAEVAPVAVSGEVFPAGLIAGDIYFAGGLERHRNLTSVVIEDSATSPAPLVITTNYTVDAVTGKVTIVNPGSFTQPFTMDYSHQDPPSVSFLSAAQKEYALFFEGINTRDGNAKGSLEVYRTRFDPAALVDFLSDELQQMELTGSMLADPSKDVTDTEFGQFGRRVGF